MNGRHALILALLLAPAAWGQGIYKWVDAEGQVHYGEAPPEEASADSVNVKSAPAAPVSAQERLENTRRVLQSFEEERSQKQEQAAKAAQEAEERKRMCTEAKGRARGYQEARYLYEYDNNGERRVFSDAEHAAALKRAEAEVSKYCK